MNTENIKDAFNKYNDGQFMDAKDIIRSEVKQHFNDYLKDKLNLENDPIITNNSSENEED